MLALSSGDRGGLAHRLKTLAVDNNRRSLKLEALMGGWMKEQFSMWDDNIYKALAFISVVPISLWFFASQFTSNFSLSLSVFHP